MSGNTVSMRSDGAVAMPQYSMVSTDVAGDLVIPATALIRTLGIIQEGVAANGGAPVEGQPLAVQVDGTSYAIAGAAGLPAGSVGPLPLMAENATGALIVFGGLVDQVHCANWLPSRTKQVSGAAAGDKIRVLIVPGPLSLFV